MGLFDKKVCDFCGGGIGLLGNRKLADGNMCKDCASRISPHLTGRKQFTVQEMSEHLAYREMNQDRIRNFMVTTTMGKRTKLYIDVNQCQWFISSNDNYVNTNQDVFDFAQVTGCQVEIQDHRSEVHFIGPDGKRVSFNPPEYDYDYDIWVKIFVASPFTQDIEFKVNDYRIEDADTYEYYEAKSIADNIKYVMDQMMSGSPQITIPATFYMDPAEVERLRREREYRVRRREELLRVGPTGPRTMGPMASGAAMGAMATGPAASRPGNPAARPAMGAGATGPAASRPGNPAGRPAMGAGATGPAASRPGNPAARPAMGAGETGPAASRPGNPAGRPAMGAGVTGPAASRPGNPAARPAAGPAPMAPHGGPRPTAGPAPTAPHGGPRPTVGGTGGRPRP